MNFKLFTIGMIAILVRIVLSKYYPLIYYWSALYIIVSFLCIRTGYKQYSLFANTFFFLYICFITWVRTKSFLYSKNGEFWLNNIEHILFAVVVCLLISLFTRTVLNAKLSFTKTLISTIIAFNIVGVINEYFQNVINHRTFLHLTDDSKKDLLMNVFGTVFFILLALLWHFSKTNLQQKFARIAQQ